MQLPRVCLLNVSSKTKQKNNLMYTKCRTKKIVFKETTNDLMKTGFGVHRNYAPLYNIDMTRNSAVADKPRVESAQIQWRG